MHLIGRVATDCYCLNIQSEFAVAKDSEWQSVVILETGIGFTLKKQKFWIPLVDKSEVENVSDEEYPRKRATFGELDWFADSCLCYG
jgi:hypothetical protein